MQQEKPQSYFASFGQLDLRTQEANGRYAWTVKDSMTGDQIAGGEAADLPGAMVNAAEAAGAEWGAVRWRGREDGSEE